VSRGDSPHSQLALPAADAHCRAGFQLFPFFFLFFFFPFSFLLDLDTGDGPAKPGKTRKEKGRSRALGFVLKTVFQRAPFTWTIALGSMMIFRIV